MASRSCDGGCSGLSTNTPGLVPIAGEAPELERERSVAAWTYHHEQPAGAGTDTLSGSEALYLPLRAATSTVGVLAVQRTAHTSMLDPDQRQLLDTLTRQTAMPSSARILRRRPSTAACAPSARSFGARS
jgi:two-component system sensor histidine kinase KdpD